MIHSATVSGLAPSSPTPGPTPTPALALAPTPVTASLSALALASLVLALPVLAQRPAELLFRGGPVHTLEPQQPLATALAVRGRTISWVGQAADSGPWVGPQTLVIDLAGRALLPGFADAHLHLENYGQLLDEVDLRGTGSDSEVLALVAAKAATVPPGSWISGRGWDQNDWDDPAFPRNPPLSAAVPDHPVLLRRIDGHAVLVNRLGLERAGVDEDTATPAGGRILRDGQGRPTGVLIDKAMDLVTRVVPRPTPARRRARILAAIEALHRRGLTAVHDAGVDASAVALYAELARAGRFTLRNHVMINEDEPLLAAPASESGWPTADLTGQGLIAVRAIKASADGALGSRGAALLQDYADAPGRGLLTLAPGRLEQLARFAVDHGWQLCTHAIGDRANRLVLDAYAGALARAADGAALRFRIEHAQVLHPDDIPRFAALGVVPSMQAQHQTSDMPWAEARLGPERIRGAYAWRALLDTGVVIPGGSDAPVEEPDPLAAFAAAVTRADAHGQPPGGWYPEQAMDREEALAQLTLWPAWAAFDEQRLGSLRPGKLADLVLLSGDPLTVPASQLGQLTVELTVFDGQIVYTRPTDEPR